MADRLTKVMTVNYPSRMRQIPTACGVVHSYLSGGTSEVTEFKALWDTGADGSVVSNSVVAALGLMPDGKIPVYHADGMSIVNVYTVDLRLPSGVVFRKLKVTSGDLKDTDVLIGMDVISMGDFAVTARNGCTKFSFQIPSTYDIDFSSEAAR